MQPSAREDYLEAVLNLTRSRQRSPFLHEIALSLGRDIRQTEEDMDILRREGDLTISGRDEAALTPAGHETAERVMRKHRLLQCFLTEMLGVEPSKASDEACMLEHAVSDETIDRLGRYLDQPGVPCGRRHKRHSGKSVRCSYLTDCEEETDLRVREVVSGDEIHRLLDLGIVPGEKIRLIRKLGNHAVVVRVKGCDIALSDEVAASIRVETIG
jgi:DtxR family transcriptional regulator, Mn-dependent transcriptional regulator